MAILLFSSLHGRLVTSDLVDDTFYNAASASLFGATTGLVWLRCSSALWNDVVRTNDVFGRQRLFGSRNRCLPAVLKCAEMSGAKRLARITRNDCISDFCGLSVGSAACSPTGTICTMLWGLAIYLATFGVEAASPYRTRTGLHIRFKQRSRGPVG